MSQGTGGFFLPARNRAGWLIWAVLQGVTPVVLSALPAMATGQEVIAPRPVEHFAQLPMLAQVVLSPDGLRYAALVNSGDETRLVTRTMSEPSPRVALSTDNQELRLNWVRWVNNERLVVSVRFEARRGTVGTLETRLLSVRHDGSGQVPLIEQQRAGTYLDQVQDRVVDWMEDDGSRLLLDGVDPRSLRPVLFSVDVNTGERRRVATTSYDVGRWFTDAQHRARVITRGVDKDDMEVMLSADGEGEWRSLWRFNRWGRDQVIPLGFGRDPDKLFVRALHGERWAVFEVDLKSPDLARRLVLANPARDVRGSLMRSAEGDILGIVDWDDPTYSDWWDPEVRELARSLEQALPGRHNRLLQFSRDGSRYLVHSIGAGQPGRFFLGDRRTGRMAQLGVQYPGLDKADLAGRQVAVALRGREGAPLSAFLTRPRQAPAGPLPLVLIPEGGPSLPAIDTFHPLAEFFADRGYAVLRVAYRDPAGLRTDFLWTGLQRWGREMQDDLEDAVRWAVEQRVADPARVCVVGIDQGGYAALLSAVRAPALYRCVASLGAVTDLFALYEHFGRFGGARLVMEAQVGHFWQDRERLRAASPALQAKAIQADTLLVHGVRDRLVPVEQARQMTAALAAAGKTHELLELPEGDHLLTRQSHQVAFYRALDTFLKRHLAPTP